MKENLKIFDQFLNSRELSFEAVIIGGAALLVLGIIDRATRDVDCLTPHIPNVIKSASIEFAKQVGLDSEWLNNGPESLQDDLPPGWKDRAELIYKGEALTLHTLGRIDLLRSKLYAYCDRQQDLQDCIAMAPSQHELQTIKPWLCTRDANPLWEEHVETSLKYLIQKLHHDS